MNLIQSLVALTFLTGSFSAGVWGDPTASLSVSQARRDVHDTLARMYRGPFNLHWQRNLAFTTMPIRDLKVYADRFEFEDARETKSKWTGAAQSDTRRLVFKFKGHAPIALSDDHPHTPGGAWYAGTEDRDACIKQCGTFYWTDRADAERFIRAVNRLITAANSSDPSDLAVFRSAAAEWRQLKTKPPLSPEADKHRILAEASLRENDLSGAALHYDEALEAFPMWPEGWSNAALIYGELQDYAAAADHIRHFLELAPDAPEAKAARERLVVWEEKSR